MFSLNILCDVCTQISMPQVISRTVIFNRLQLRKLVYLGRKKFVTDHATGALGPRPAYASLFFEMMKSKELKEELVASLGASRAVLLESQEDDNALAHDLVNERDVDFIRNAVESTDGISRDRYEQVFVYVCGKPVAEDIGS